MRVLTDWIGPRGWFKKISVRHTCSTFEGDLMRFSARIAEKSGASADPWIVCEIEQTSKSARSVVATSKCQVNSKVKTSG
jgi:hypothetical protein